MTLRRLGLLLGAALVTLGQTSWGQKVSSWRGYKLADGLPESACFSVTWAPQGKLLVRHLNLPFISELDGYSVNLIPAPEAGSGRIYESPAGQLWTVVPEGLQEFKAGSWVLHRVPEMAAELHGGRGRLIDPIPLCPVRQGVVLLLLGDRLLEFNAEDPDHHQIRLVLAANQTGLRKFLDLTLAHDGGLWLTGARGLRKAPGPVRNLKSTTEWREYLFPESLQIQNLLEPFEEEDGSLTAVAEGAQTRQKVIVSFDGQRWGLKEMEGERIRYAWRGPDKTCWAVSIDSLFQWETARPEISQNEEIAARQYFDLARESSGAFWLATSDGLFRYAPLTWRSPEPVSRFKSLVHCLTADQEGRLWFVCGSSLYGLLNGQLQEYPFPSASARTLQSTRCLFPLKNGTMLLEAGERVFQFEPRRHVFVALQLQTPARPLRILGTLKNGSPCLQFLNPDGSGQQCDLQQYEDNHLKALSELAPAPSLVTNLQVLFSAQNGDLWLGGEQGTACYHEKKWRTFVSTDKSNPEGVLAFTELSDGKVWCATRDQIWEFDNRNWSVVRRGFDRINALLHTRDGSVWVASNSGLIRYCQGAWVENGVEEGLPGATVREIYEDPRGGLWAGTTRGLSLYHPEADPDPPKTSINKLADNEDNLPAGTAVTLTFSGQDRWKYTACERLLYSYRLDEHDWSPFQEANHVSFMDLPAGKHYFQVRALDRNGNMEPEPAKREFVIVLPWYKETRLVLISFAGLTGALFFAALAFNRHRQLLRSYAEVGQKVAERTRELELANRELLHSQKMNALGTLAAGIAHDFNNILSIIKGSAQIIEENLENSEKIRTRAERIKTVVEQGSGIVKAMLGFSRDSDQQLVQCDLNMVVDDTIRLLGDRFLREVQVRFEGASALPSVLVFKDFVQQILLNFIFNAAESMAQRKEMLLATRPLEKLPAGLVLTPAAAATYVGILVQDFGCGIPPQNFSRIFEPFFTTKALSSRRGTGLGLSMVYELAKKMGAGLAVDSVVGQGSTFTLILPVRNPASAPHLVAQTPSLPAASVTTSKTP